MRNRELRASLQTLSEYSLTSTRRTDDTYYSILEKLAVLRSTIGELQELSSFTRELHEDFQNDADELEEEVNGQLDAFHNFEPQEQQVAVLEERVNAGREKARGLNRRLDDARKRVEVRERVEKEWEAKISSMPPPSQESCFI
jgi:DNA repair exonuclease SbcCD ATPase subunit